MLEDLSVHMRRSGASMAIEGKMMKGAVAAVTLACCLGTAVPAWADAAGPPPSVATPPRAFPRGGDEGPSGGALPATPQGQRNRAEDLARGKSNCNGVRT